MTGQSNNGCAILIGLLLCTVIGMFLLTQLLSASDLAQIAVMRQHFAAGGCVQPNDVEEMNRLNVRIVKGHQTGWRAAFANPDTAWTYTQLLEIRVCK